MADVELGVSGSMTLQQPFQTSKR